MTFNLLVGDCREHMAAMDAESVDAIVTDPPYDLTANKKGGSGMASVDLSTPYGRTRITVGNGAGGFMGMAWDGTGVAFAPGTWHAALRVLKPGGHLLAFGGTRTFHRMTAAIEDAGFEIRDCLSWMYGTGFPKSHNLHGDWEGWGTALKPAWEPIVMARKPFKGTVAANVEQHGTGAINVDGCRIESAGRPYREIDPKPQANGTVYAGRREAGHGFDGGSRAIGTTDIGRWPANVVLDEVAAAMLDGQTGTLSSGAMNGSYQGFGTQGIYGLGGQGERIVKGDSGGASRFFYTAKASRSERGEGNTHPTVKPLSLMQWLVRLVTTPGGVVLDPFMGSGSTGIAAVSEGFRFVGIELSPEYSEIARRRIEAAASTPRTIEMEFATS